MCVVNWMTSPVLGQEDLGWQENEAHKPEWRVAEGDPVRTLTPAS